MLSNIFLNACAKTLNDLKITGGSFFKTCNTGIDDYSAWEQVARFAFCSALSANNHELIKFCRYADFLYRLNDDRNIRALFERALSSLPPEESVEVFFLLFS